MGSKHYPIIHITILDLCTSSRKEGKNQESVLHHGVRFTVIQGEYQGVSSQVYGK